MTSDQELQLIARGIDGELQGEELATFERLIAEDSEARELHQRMSGLDRALRSMEAEEPPAEIREYVMARVRRRTYGRAGIADRIGTLIAGIRDVVTARPVYGWGLGVALAALILLPVAVRYGTFGDAPQQMSGTMTAPNGPVERLTIQGVDLAGVASIRHDGSVSHLQIDLRAATPVELNITYDEARFALIDIEQSFAGLSYTIAPQGGVTVDGLSSGHYELALGATGTGSSDIRVEITRQGERLFRGSLETNGEQGR